ncbi:NAD(P)H-dependent oxidoreductase [Arthrobacter castelli]|uniref:NAD(P)H-dependent oxidoreductase n=1 Tax=Arthrobacter castelli TaxID=271431 RepID=UPI001B7FD6B6|nr:NAD(P)H-dependent oxidoreductase [Arthrobacter castelli]
MTTKHTILWVSAHPEAESLNGSLRADGIRHLLQAGHEIIESDLYGMGWDPVLSGDGIVPPGDHFRVTDDTRRAYIEAKLPADVEREQQKILAADAVVVQFPLWWYGMPAILKGWFDRVFLSGFAFGKDPHDGRRLRFENGPFAGKRALVVTTLGDRPASIGPRGKSGELTELLFGLLHGTFAYTGMSALEPFAVPSADFTDAESYGDHQQQLLRRLDGLFAEPAIPYRPQFQGDYTDQWELEPSVCPGESGLSIHRTATATTGGGRPPNGSARGARTAAACAAPPKRATQRS